MFQMTLSGSLNFQFGAFTVLVVLIHSCRGQHHVSCPSEAIVATIGEDIVLPAYLEPAINALRKTIEWTRPDLSPRYVHVQRQGVKLTGNHPSYDGRTSLFSDELKLGNISLKLSRVRISDEGPYRCFLPEMKISCIIQLVVGAASSPVVQKTKNSSRVVLQCESTGWYPEPEVFWLDGEGNLLSAGPTETVRGPDDLYTVSSRVTVEKRHSNSFTCRVQQNSTNQTRETLIHVPGRTSNVHELSLLQITVIIPHTFLFCFITDDFFAGPSGSSSSLPVIVGLILCIMFVLVAAAAVVVWKWRQNKIRNKKQREDEEGGNSPELKLLMGGDTDGKHQTEETETVNNVDEFRGEPGQTETDEETLQQEANNAQCADSEGTELQFTQEAGGQTTRETETGLDQSQEETETEAVTETDSLHPVSTNLNNKPTETVTMVEERHKDNNQQTAEKKGAQSLKEKDKHGEQQTAERETLRDREKDDLKKKLKTKEREVEKFEEQITRYEGQIKDKEKQIDEVKRQLEAVKRQTEETERKMRSVKKEEDKYYKLLSVLNRREEELQEQLEKLEDRLTINSRRKKRKEKNVQLMKQELRV
uniref:Ig-like domain-containing protein n=1 Tax=Sparus aurata TaxID=8175 RepID=A0A671TP07_SPAAU